MQLKKRGFFIITAKGSTSGNVKRCKVQLFNDNIVESSFMLPNGGKIVSPKKFMIVPHYMWNGHLIQWLNIIKHV